MKRGIQMKTLRFALVFFALTATLCMCFGSRARAATELIPFYTPAPGGTAYILGAGIVTVTNKYLTDAKLVHEASTGTMDMVRRMMAREAAKKPAFALFGSPDAWKAYKGQAEYSATPFTGLRGVVFNSAFDVYLVVPASSRIKSYADVKGKRIAVGGPGSTVANSALLFLEYAGVTKNDFKPYYYTYRETVEGLQDGSLDGGFLGGGFPIAAYTELSTRNDVRIVPIDEKIMKTALTEHPYYYANVVKAKSYRGLEQDTPIFGFTGGFWTYAGVSADLIYAILKNLFEHKADYYAIHISAKEMTEGTATKGIPVPFHPGAEKYLKEIGAWKK
jgi:TRAP transporter TAXI family solute receptor